MPKAAAAKGQKSTPYAQQNAQPNIKVDASAIAHETAFNMLSEFTAQHKKEIHQRVDEIKQLKDYCEKLEQHETQRRSELAVLKDALAQRTQEMEAAQKNFHKLQYEVIHLTNCLANEKQQLAEAEISHQSTVDEYKLRFEKERQRCKMAIIAKENELSSKTKALMEQLQAANDRANRLESEKTEFVEKIQQLEAQNHEQQQTIESNQLKLEQKDQELLQKDEKIQKKTERIHSIKKQLKELQAEKLKLDKKLEIQTRKMRDMLNVLDRPYVHVAPIELRSQCSTSSMASEVEVAPTLIENNEREVAPQPAALANVSNSPKSSASRSFLTCYKRPRAEFVVDNSTEEFPPYDPNKGQHETWNSSSSSCDFGFTKRLRH